MSLLLADADTRFISLFHVKFVADVLSVNTMNQFIHTSGIFFAILGRGPRAFLIGKISDINPEFGKFSEYSKLIIFSKLT